MTLGPEVQLILLAVMLYVQDALLLLRPDEGILVATGRKHWRVRFSSDSARIGARQLYVPNLLAVHQPMFKGSWRPQATADAPGEDWHHMASRYRTLAPMVLSIFSVLFIGLPAALVLNAALRLKLALLATLYAFILLALWWVYWNRKSLPLSSRKLRGLMLECLVCPPIAANLLRRLSLAGSVKQDLLNASQQLLEPAAWIEARASFAVRTRSILDVEDPDSVHYAAVALLHQRLSEPLNEERDSPLWP
jgi:hypothetical protein